jgi:peptidyl-prolyl cis-trans isomerase C
MMKKIFSTSLLVSSLILASGTAMAEDNAIASVNNVNISEDDFQAYAKSRIGVRPGPALPAGKRQELMDELVTREIIYQAAVADGFDQDAEVLSIIREQIRNIVTGQRIEKLLADTPVSDADLRKAYDKQIAENASSEYSASHILLKTEDEAKTIIDKLNKGADFAKLAKEFSTGPSAAEGGDLGWFAANQMVKPFSDAVEKLEVGQYGNRAVQTRFGWHVIKLDAKRAIEPPSYHSMQDQLAKVIQNKIITGYIDGLREKATIVVK